MATNDPTLIISDTHLAHPAVRPARRLRAEHLRPLWRGAARLVVAGDVAELQMEPVRAEAAREVEVLRALCEQDGVELTVLSGNHDAFVSDRRHLLLGDGRVLVTHGDVLHPAIAPWARGAADMKRHTDEGTRRYCREYGLDELDLTRRLEVAQHVAHRQFADHETRGRHGVFELLARPDRVVAMARYWRNQPELGAALLEALAPRAEVLVFGHSHRPGMWRRRGRTLINLGSFVLPCRPRAVRLRYGGLSFHRVRRRADGACELVERPLFSRGLGVDEGRRDAA